jgi:hypothetical protein
MTVENELRLKADPESDDDLAHPDDIYSKFVACEMLEEIPAESNENMLNNRDGVQIRGTIAGESFNMVGLEGCTLLNR